MPELKVMLENLKHVANSPYALVGFIAVVLVWIAKLYIDHLNKRFAAGKLLKEGDRLSYFEKLVLGFPDTLTPQRMQVIKWRFMLIAYAVTLIAVIILAAFITTGGNAAKIEGLEKKIDAMQATLTRMETALKGKVPLQNLRAEDQRIQEMVAAAKTEFKGRITVEQEKELERIRNQSQRIIASAALREIALALHNWHRDGGKETQHSWRTNIYPFFESNIAIPANIQPYVESELPTSPRNKEFLDKLPNKYLAPGQTGNFTNYVLVKQDEDKRLNNQRTVQDGLINPVLVIEIRNSGIVWPVNQDFTVDEAIKAIKNNSMEPDGTLAVRGDASVIFIKNTLSEKELRAVLTGKPEGN